MKIDLKTLIWYGIVLAGIVSSNTVLQAQVNTQGKTDTAHTTNIKENGNKIDCVKEDARNEREKIYERVETKQQTMITRQQTQGEAMARIEAILSRMESSQ